MKTHELFETVISADFSKGRGVNTPGIDIPQGYDRFEVEAKRRFFSWKNYWN